MADIREVEIPVRLKFEVPIVGVIERESDQSNFDDVGDFHRKFELSTFPDNCAPNLLNEDLFEFRLRFLEEELQEFKDGYKAGNLAEVADALIDLVYVAMGTAHFMGLPWQELWEEVQRANMTKERASSVESSKRHHHFDVIKPPGWTPPDIEGVLARWQAETE
ncbi:MAG: nucleoside triphosphate pyrophosphohydrolase family protein [Actinobacteria bacterium]|nr:nucleoside triphosphate pyrophosphohydrolase family protein [Actinomycetota bacterium]